MLMVWFWNSRRHAEVGAEFLTCLAMNIISRQVVMEM